MWYSIVKRRELLELGQKGKRPPSFFSDLNGALEKYSSEPRTILILWDKNPNLQDSSQPILAAMHRSEINEFLAAVNSIPSGSTPFTAFCRVLSTDDARELSGNQDDEKRNVVIQALVGLSFSESMAHAGGKIQAAELTPAICKRTIAYAWAKALSSYVSADYLERLSDLWLEALSLSGNGDKIDFMQSTIFSLTPIFDIAARICRNNTSLSPIEMLCKALIDQDGVLLSEAWGILIRNFPNPLTLQQVAESTREERGTYFQSMMNASVAGLGEDANAIRAFLATQISPGSFDHLQLLSGQANNSLPLWYSFLAALQRPRGLLGFSGGLGSRLYRDLRRKEFFDAPPVGDISLSELRVIAKAGLDGLAKRLGHSNEIEIEIAPLVTCSFRFHGAINRQSVLFPEKEPVQPIPEREIVPALSDYEKIISVIGSLQEISKSIKNGNYSSENKVSKRVRKK